MRAAGPPGDAVCVERPRWPSAKERRGPPTERRRFRQVVPRKDRVETRRGGPWTAGVSPWLRAEEKGRHYWRALLAKPHDPAGLNTALVSLPRGPEKLVAAHRLPSSRGLPRDGTGSRPPHETCHGAEGPAFACFTERRSRRLAGQARRLLRSTSKRQLPS